MWDDLEDPEVQKAVIIYNDRVNTYRKMKEIDAVIDSDPTEKRIIDLAELRNRNLLSFRELQAYNDTGKWLNKHPLLTHFSLRFRMKEMLKKEPDRFLDDYAKTNGYVTRYRSYLNNEKRSKDQKDKDKKNLKKYEEQEQIMKEVLNEHNNGI